MCCSKIALVRHCSKIVGLSIAKVLPRAVEFYGLYENLKSHAAIFKALLNNVVVRKVVKPSKKSNFRGHLPANKMADLLRGTTGKKNEWQLRLSSEFPLEYVRREAASQYDFFVLCRDSLAPVSTVERASLVHFRY